MGAAEVASIGFALTGEILGQLKNAGIIGNPDWVKYVQAGMFVASRASALVAKMQSDPEQYKNLTPEQVRALLLPTEWEELERLADARLAAEKAAER